MYLWMAWNLLCRPGWRWILRDPPAFVSWMLELKAYTTTLHLLRFKKKKKQGLLVPQTVPRMALNSWFSWLRAGDYKQVPSTRLEPRAPCSVIGSSSYNSGKKVGCGERIQTSWPSVSLVLVPVESESEAGSVSLCSPSYLRYSSHPAPFSPQDLSAM